jgi:hypothetical protein
MLFFSAQTCITSAHMLLIAHENYKCYSQEVTSNSDKSSVHIHKKKLLVRLKVGIKMRTNGSVQ